MKSRIVVHAKFSGKQVWAAVNVADAHSCSESCLPPDADTSIAAYTLCCLQKSVIRHVPQRCTEHIKGCNLPNKSRGAFSTVCAANHNMR